MSTKIAKWLENSALAGGTNTNYFFNTTLSSNRNTEKKTTLYFMTYH